MSSDAKRILARRILIVGALVVAGVCFFSATPADAPGYALESELILRFERAAVPLALLLGLGGLAIRLWIGDKVSDTQVPGAGLSAEEATKPTELLKEGVDKDVRDLSERLLKIEKYVDEQRRDQNHP